MTSVIRDSLRVGDQIGQFSLIEKIGEGGMGVVWRAHHVEMTGSHVAIKLIAPDWSMQQSSHALFEREMRAVARLNHPHLVSIYDYGITPSKRPFLVMEYMSRGSLHHQWPWLDWPTTKSILLDMAHALAHAHARGIIHKDLKPANILLGGADTPVAKLTDFGVAHALSDVAARGESGQDLRELSDGGAGTPSYMPPEQIVGRWRDFGPWTDLYALGCVAWEMICGQSPFWDPVMMKVLSGHMYQGLPAFEPRFDVPREVEFWLRKLLNKSEHDRFPMAHDAARALAMLPGEGAMTWLEIESYRHHGRVEGRPIQLTDTIKDVTKGHVTPKAEQFTQFAWGGQAESTTEDMEEPKTPVYSGSHQGTHQGAHLRWEAQEEEMHAFLTRLAKQPWPQNWRGETEDVELLNNTGLGVFGVREVSFVGRHKERDTLWEVLRQVYEQEQPQAVFLSGPSGVGKSCLAEWLATRAQELGVAHTIRLSHDPVSNRIESIARLVEYDACCYGLAREQIERRLVAQFERHMNYIWQVDEMQALAGALAQFMTPQGDASAQNIGEREQGVLLGKYLHKMVRTYQRPLVVWLDDVQWSGVMLGVVRRLVAQAQLPVLFLMTLRDDLIVETPHQEHVVHQIVDAGGLNLELQALDLEDQRHLLDRLLPLADKWREKVLTRTQGNPLFCVQLVADWIERGLLIPSPQGFQVMEGARLELPADLHALWRLRLERALGAMSDPSQAWGMLALGAALGLEIDRHEWDVALELGGYAQQGWERMFETLLEQRLVRRTQKGWEFVHGMLRESIMGHAHLKGILEEAHKVSARALREVWGEHMVGQAERVAHHWIEAKAPDQALGPLLEATYHYQISGQYGRAEQALESYEQALEMLALAPTDLYVLRARMQRVWLKWSRHGIDEQLKAEVDEIAAVAQLHGEYSLLGECWRWRGLVSRFDDNPQESLRQFYLARDYYQQMDDVEGQSRCNLSLAVSLRECGQLDEAEKLLVEAIEFATRREFYILLPRCFGNLAEVAMQRKRWTQAQERFERAKDVADQMGDRRALAFALGGLAQLAVLAEEWEKAHDLWRQQEALFSAMGSSYRVQAQVGLATIGLLSKRLEEAHQWLTVLDQAGQTHTLDPKVRVLSGLVEFLYQCYTDQAKDAEIEMLYVVEALIVEEQARKTPVEHVLLPDVIRALYRTGLTKEAQGALSRIEMALQGRQA